MAPAKQQGTSEESDYVPSEDSDTPRAARPPPAPWKYHQKCSNDHVTAACKELVIRAGEQEEVGEAEEDGGGGGGVEGPASEMGSGVVKGPKCMKRVLEEACVATCTPIPATWG